MTSEDRGPDGPPEAPDRPWGSPPGALGSTDSGDSWPPPAGPVRRTSGTARGMAAVPGSASGTAQVPPPAPDQVQPESIRGAEPAAPPSPPRGPAVATGKASVPQRATPQPPAPGSTSTRAGEPATGEGAAQTRLGPGQARPSPGQRPDTVYGSAAVPAVSPVSPPAATGSPAAVGPTARPQPTAGADETAIYGPSGTDAQARAWVASRQGAATAAQHQTGRDRQAEAPTDAGEQPAAAPPETAPTRRPSRRGLLIGLAIAAVLALLAAVGVLVTAYVNRSSSFAVGSCVKQDGTRAVRAACSDPAAFTVVSKKDRSEDCPDINQPFVVIDRGGGRSEVLCLRPADQR